MRETSNLLSIYSDGGFIPNTALEPGYYCESVIGTVSMVLANIWKQGVQIEVS